MSWEAAAARLVQALADKRDEEVLRAAEALREQLRADPPRSRRELEQAHLRVRKLLRLLTARMQALHEDLRALDAHRTRLACTRRLLGRAPHKP